MNLNFGIFAKDEASKVVDDLGGAFERNAKKVDDFSKATVDSGGKVKDYGGHLEGVGEKADVSEQRVLGMKDAVDGVGTIMQGPGKQGIAAYLQGWADLSSGIANFAIPALKQVTFSNIKNTASTVASTVAQKTAAFASKAWAGAQWLLNAALSANPIGLVIAGVVALAAIFVVAWRRSETFRNIVTGAFRAVKNIVTGTFGWIRDHWPLVAGILTGGILPAINIIRNHFTGVKNWIVGRFNDVVNFFTGIPGRLARVGGHMFDFVAQAFKSAWNWIIARWNGFQFTLPSIHIGPVKFGGYTIGLPDLPYLAKGGITTGPTLAVVGDNPSGREAIVPLPHSGGLPGLGGPVVIRFDFAGADSALLELFRKAIRARGGDVQIVLGQPA